LSNASAYQTGIFKLDAVRSLARWLAATPHPTLAVEITPEQISAARFSRAGALEIFGVEMLPPGAVVPSAIETNITNPAAVKIAFGRLAEKLQVKEQESAALIVPDPVIRVFVQHFDDFPRSAEEAVPMLRWKLKKSVPFEVEETLLSYMRQQPRGEGVDVVTAIARLRIIKEYESVLDAKDVLPGVVLSSTLAAISLLQDSRPTLLARLSGTSLTTAIVREGVLAGYRCTELPSTAAEITPHILLEEIYPLAAYYQDTWQESIQAVRVAGLQRRLPEFVRPLQDEFKCDVGSLLSSAISEGRLRGDVRPLAERELDGLVGWMMHRN
jgi:type IV pilus assembly protein PilM